MRLEERNKAVVLAYVDAFNRGDFAALRSIYAADAVVQGVLGRGGMGFVLPVWQELHEAFGIQLQVDDMVVAGETVVVRYTERGTFRAPFRGNPPTGRSYELVAMEWFRLHEGRIVERWGARDAAALARQVGMKPA